MENGGSMEKVIGAILIITGVVCFIVWPPIQAQGLRDNPIVLDEKVIVRPDSTISVVNKDEYQRIVNKQTDRIQRLENRVTLLESKVANLEIKQQGE